MIKYKTFYLIFFGIFSSKQPSRKNNINKPTHTHQKCHKVGIKHVPWTLFLSQSFTQSLIPIGTELLYNSKVQMKNQVCDVIAHVTKD